MIFGRRAVIGGMVLAPLASCGPRDPEAPVPKPPTRPQGSGNLVELTARDAGLKLDLRYATTNNFTGRALYREARAFLQADAASALKRAASSARAAGYGLTIFDAYRPWRVTKKLWDATPPSQRDFVANPKKGSRHNRGCAIDLSLHDLATGALVEMPTPFDDFTAKADRSYGGASAEATANRARLQTWMEAEGFIGLSNEWWHFDYRDWEKYPVLDVPFEAIRRAA
jgi:zinc D-Ala-D-Ala dipeptidase